MGQFLKAQQVYEVMLQQITDGSEKGRIYYQLGSAKKDQGEYEEAITYYEKLLTIYKKTPPPNHLSLASCYNQVIEKKL